MVLFTHVRLELILIFFCSVKTMIALTLVMSERERQYRDTRVEEQPLYEPTNVEPSTSHDIDDDDPSTSGDYQSHGSEPHEHESHDH